jgi:hypothetical protein
MSNFYSLLQNQVRFNGEQNLGAGGVGNMNGLSWNGLGVNVWVDVPDKYWWNLTLEDFVRITATSPSRRGRRTWKAPAATSAGRRAPPPSWKAWCSHFRSASSAATRRPANGSSRTLRGLHH